MSVDWDARYARKAYVYGEKACVFLEEALARGWLPAAPARGASSDQGVRYFAPSACRRSRASKVHNA